jgi:hypothetical protein
MAQGVGSGTACRFGNDTFGGKLYGAIDYKGSSSYVQGGDLLSHKQFGFQNTITDLCGSMDQTNKFMAVGRPLQNDVTTWQLVYISLTTATVGGQAQTAGQEAVAGTNLSTFTFRLAAHGV